MFKKTEYNLPSCCKLPLTIEVDKLREEFENEVKGMVRPGESNNPMRKGWLRYVLFKNNSHYPDRSNDAGLLKRQTYLHEILNGHLKECTLIGATYAVIPPQGSIGIHQDHLKSDNKRMMRTMNETVRLHIPLYTSSQVFMFMGKKFHQMNEGELWMLNNHHYHGVLNEDDDVNRNHLILDVIPSEALIATMLKPQQKTGFDDLKRLKFLMRISHRKKVSSLRKSLPLSTRISLLFK